MYRDGFIPSFTHCTDIIFSKELVILGSKANGVTDRILDLYILIAKYKHFYCKAACYHPTPKYHPTPIFEE